MTTKENEPAITNGMTRSQYASENILQSYDILDTGRPNGIWVVYIHGGYFRDPKVDSTSFNQTVTLIESNDYKQRISGYVSINYRLSPHPSHPPPPETPPYTLNNARWPDQPNDIIAALRHLQTSRPASKEYILAGHSVGATLTFIAALRCQNSGLAVPRALVGVSGIYDFPRIHGDHPEYADMTKNAMDERQFAEASPALHSVEEYLRVLRSESNALVTVLIAHSKDDGLVPWTQAMEIFAMVQRKEFIHEFLEIYGEHNEIWQKDELSRVIQKTLDMLVDTVNTA